MENCGFIYKLTSPSEKCYIGQTWNIEGRNRLYKGNSCKRQPKLYNALKKYGFKNFEHEILDICYSQEDLDDAEIYWISYFESVNKGYNCTSGGFGGKPSKETIEKIRISNLGQKHSYEDKIKCGLVNKGKILTDEHKRKISTSAKQRKWSANTREKMKHKSIYCYQIENLETGQHFSINNLRDFCESNKLNLSSVIDSVLRLSTYKRIWKVTRMVKELHSIPQESF